MKPLLCLITLLGLCNVVAAELTLTEEGIANCTIVVDSEATEVESEAARDLQSVLNQVTGARIPLQEHPSEKVNIYVGRSADISKLLPDLDWPALGTDGVVVKTIGNDLIISGGQPRGVTNAVYTFLYDVVGCRWWTPDAETYPHKPTLAISRLDTVYVPPFEFRFPDALGRTPRLFRYRLRGNATRMGFDPDGESVLRYLLPHRKHFVSHPDWYMYAPKDGQLSDKYSYVAGHSYLKEDPDKFRVAQTTRRLPYQPCLTNEGAIAAATEAALARLESEYPKMTASPKVLWVVQQDGRWMCCCDNCNAVRAKEGSDSANWLRLVNHIAKAVEKKYPDVLVGMHAYLHTIKPPKTVRPRDNVLIYMASLDRDHKLSIGELIDGKYLQRWCRIAKHVWVWDYDAGFHNHILPHPNHLDTADSIKFCAEVGAKGIREQGATSELGDLVHMRHWVNAQMMWNPNQDPQTLRTEFLNNYYGPAGPYLMRYIKKLDEIIHRDGGKYLAPFASTTEGWLELEDLNDLTRIFDAASEATTEEPFAERLRLARRSITVVWLERYHALKAEAKQKGLAFLGPQDPHAVVEGFAAIQDEVGNYGENRQFPDYVEKLRKSLAAKVTDRPKKQHEKSKNQQIEAE